MLGAAITAWVALSVRVKVLTSLSAFVASLAGAVIAVPPAWSALGLPEVATRQWVRIDVHAPLKVAQAETQKQVIELQIDVANGKLDQLDNSRAALEIEKLKTSDDQIKATAETQIRKIDRDSAAITDQIRVLRALRAQ